MNAVLAELKRLADSRQREVLMRFFKTGKGEYGEGDEFLGIKVPVVRLVVKEHWAECTDGEIGELVTSRFHEARLAGLLIMCRKFKAAKKDEAEQRRIVDKYLGYAEYINNWDLVDLSCYELLGHWFLGRDREPLYRMAAAGRTIWEQRIAMVTTMQFIRHGDFQATLDIADILLEHPHDLIHKAVGWMLREVGNRDRALLEAFLAGRYRRMPRTMLRYAIEKFPEELRQAYLRGER